MLWFALLAWLQLPPTEPPVIRPDGPVTLTVSAPRATAVIGLSAPPDIPEGETLTAAWQKRPAAAPSVRVLLLCGADDPFLDEARQAVAVLKAAGAAVDWIETAGGHDWRTWRDHLGRVLPLLFRTRAVPSPAAQW